MLFKKRHSKEWKTKRGKIDSSKKVDDMNKHDEFSIFFYKTSGWIFFTFFFDDDIATFSVPFFLRFG